MGILDSESPEWKAAWPQLVKDTQRIIDAAGVTISGPTEDEDIVTPPLVNEKDGINICGAGEEAYEPFILVPKDQNRGVNGLQYCKTGRRDYDDVVTCILLRAKMLAPNSFYLSSDGYWDEWKPAREIYQKIWPDASIECPFNDDEDEGEENSEGEERSNGSEEGGSDEEPDNRSAHYHML
ncbi:uncharacterized protein N7477_005885 [Penicillium maclennaniae]|uniref:uncharacterized protein n=1 Tax=Penicillium maclennaniae TaxID=1343394 RepID=UPI002540E54E|nr:uncharacterized protein N7477_005885 [Penicillium maclennaniae]KAJ5670522.1 hypothetical protein N7477_005885 [Penicillium maclennaniae]